MKSILRLFRKFVLILDYLIKLSSMAHNFCVFNQILCNFLKFHRFLHINAKFDFILINFTKLELILCDFEFTFT